MDAKELVIVWLSLQLLVSGVVISKMAYDLGFERGKSSVWASFATDGTEGTCLAPTGCKDIDKGVSSDKHIKALKRH